MNQILQQGFIFGIFNSLNKRIPERFFFNVAGVIIAVFWNFKVWPVLNWRKNAWQ
jgi:hypothetical protein